MGYLRFKKTANPRLKFDLRKILVMNLNHTGRSLYQTSLTCPEETKEGI